MGSIAEAGGGGGKGSGPRRLKWSLEKRSGGGKAGGGGGALAAPPAYSTHLTGLHTELSKNSDTSHLIMKKSWEVALGPLKQVPMNLFIMYMAGNSISIFPIMMVGMLIVRPLKALLAVGGSFRGVEGGSAGQRLVFVLGNLVNVALALYKCHSMGLLPTHSSDWLAFVPPRQRLEFAAGGLLLAT